MTLQEAKDQVAKEEGYKDWTTMENSSNVSWTCLLQCSEDAAKLYGKSKWDEALDAYGVPPLNRPKFRR